MKGYQEAVLEAMEDIVTSFDLTATVSQTYVNAGVLFAGDPFGFVAQAKYDFQPDVTTVLFNDASLGSANNCFRWRHNETAKASAMLQRWGQLIEAGLRD